MGFGESGGSSAQKLRSLLLLCTTLAQRGADWVNLWAKAQGEDPGTISVQLVAVTQEIAL